MQIHFLVFICTEICHVIHFMHWLNQKFCIIADVSENMVNVEEIPLNSDAVAVSRTPVQIGMP